MHTAQEIYIFNFFTVIQCFRPSCRLFSLKDYLICLILNFIFRMFEINFTSIENSTQTCSNLANLFFFILFLFLFSQTRTSVSGLVVSFAIQKVRCMLGLNKCAKNDRKSKSVWQTTITQTKEHSLKLYLCIKCQAAYCV